MIQFKVKKFIEEKQEEECFGCIMKSFSQCLSSTSTASPTSSTSPFIRPILQLIQHSVSCNADIYSCQLCECVETMVKQHIHSHPPLCSLEPCVKTQKMVVIKLEKRQVSSLETERFDSEAVIDLQERADIFRKHLKKMFATSGSAAAAPFASVNNLSTAAADMRLEAAAVSSSAAVITRGAPVEEAMTGSTLPHQPHSAFKVLVSIFSEDAEAPPSTQILVSGLVDDVYGDFRPTTDRPPNDVIYCSVDDMIFETQVGYLFIFCSNVYLVLLHESLHCVHLMYFVLKKWSDLNELAANYFDGSGYVLRDHMKVVQRNTET